MTTYLPVISIQKNYLKQRNGDISCTPFYNQYYDCTNAFGSKYRTIDGACNNRFDGNLFKDLQYFKSSFSFI